MRESGNHAFSVPLQIVGDKLRLREVDRSRGGPEHRPGHAQARRGNRYTHLFYYVGKFSHQSSTLSFEFVNLMLLGMVLGEWAFGL